MHHISFAGRTLRLPRSRWVRTTIGAVLVILGFLGFLPILGFWMIPLGLLILSVDIAFVRRLRRLATVRLGVFLRRRAPRLARMLGYTVA